MKDDEEMRKKGRERERRGMDEEGEMDEHEKGI